MKTNLIKKSSETMKFAFEEMNNEEMKSIQGGVKGYLVQNPDGTYTFIITVQ